MLNILSLLLAVSQRCISYLNPPIQSVAAGKGALKCHPTVIFEIQDVKTAKLKTPDLRQYPLTTLIKLMPGNW